MFHLKQASSFSQGATGQVFGSLKHTTPFNNTVGSVSKEAKDGADLGTAYVVLNENQKALATLGLMSNREKHKLSLISLNLFYEQDRRSPPCHKQPNLS